MNAVKKWIPILIGLGAALLILTVLKYVLHSLGPHNPWTSYFYFYGFGIPVYTLTLILLVRLGAINLSYPPDRIVCMIVTIGFTVLVTIHGLWTWLALALPYKGVL